MKENQYRQEHYTWKRTSIDKNTIHEREPEQTRTLQMKENQYRQEFQIKRDKNKTRIRESRIIKNPFRKNIKELKTRLKL